MNLFPVIIILLLVAIALLVVALRYAMKIHERLQQDRTREIVDEMEQHQEKARKSVLEGLQGQFELFSKMQQETRQSSSDLLGHLKSSVEQQLTQMQSATQTQLNEIRHTVDEKLHTALEQKLTETFNRVSTQLEKVHQGLGDMQHLATNVGDLRQILSNVKTRGTFGEIQLGAILEQIFSPEQYAKTYPPREMLPGWNSR